MSDHNASSQIDSAKEADSSKKVIRDFIRVFLVPTLVNKVLMLYFGLNYTNYPGEGYGYGLIASLLFLVFTIGRFLWKYRHIEDP